jgi:hypothetical protein
MPLAVNEQSAEIAKLACEWPLTEALMGGTRKMRDAGDKLLPKFPAEEPDAHRARIATATLFPAFRRTVSVMAGKPFSKPMTFSKETPAEIQTWAEDIDREGVNLDTFAAEMLAEVLAHGLGGILVEAPKPIQGATGTPTKAEQDAAGIRPYFVRVRHGQILGGRISRINGKATLTQLRLKEAANVEDGEYGETCVERVRVLRPGSWDVQEEAGDAWVSVESGLSGLLTIPFVPLYGSRLAYLMGMSPLLDLAYLNVKHWQSQSDQDTILHVARVPILLATGFEDKDQITVGASQAIKTTSAIAKLAWVEHSGEAIGAGSASLAALEDQMIQAGAELLVKKPGTRTATETSNDAEANKSDLQRITEGFEDGLDQALQFMADYAKLGSGGNVTLFKDFGASNLSDASGQLILSMEEAGLISKPTAINEMKRRGELSAEVDAEKEAVAVAAQPPKPVAPVMASTLAPPLVAA